MTTAPGTSTARTSLGATQLLVVEDNDSIAEPLIIGLRREGFEVTRAADGKSALAAVEPDFVVDLGLSELDGAEVARRISARSKVPIGPEGSGSIPSRSNRSPADGYPLYGSTGHAEIDTPK